MCGLIALSAWYLIPGIFRAWFYNSDEYAVIGEVIRFVQFNFQQQYFDQPDTPIMLIASVCWGVLYGFAWVIGAAPHNAGIADFSLRHLPQVFEMTRAISLLPGLISIWLLYRVASRLTNRAGGCVAATVLALSPVFALGESFIRPEPLAVVLFLLAILYLDRGLGKAGREARSIALAGLFAGLAAATRFHSITATAPVLLMMLLASRSPAPPYPEWMRAWWKRMLSIAFILAVAGTIAIKSGYLRGTSEGSMLTEMWPEGFDALYRLCLIAAVLIAGLFALEVWKRTRTVADRLLHPRVFVLSCGMICGFLAGTPTVLWRRAPLAHSIHFYTTQYLDFERMSWPLARHMGWLVRFYLRTVAPDNFSLILIAGGALLIVIRRDRRFLPFLAGAILFFVARPLNTLPFDRHVVLWLPLFAIMAGYLVARVYEWMPLAMANVAVVVLICGMVVTMHWGPKSLASDMAADQEKKRSVVLATDWIHQHAEPYASVAISFQCFNPDAVVWWMRAVHVPLPPPSDPRNYLVWWSDRKALRGLRGYACETPDGGPTNQGVINAQTPGEGMNPYSDPAFKLVQSFGSGPTQVDLFRFDFTHAAP